MKSLWLLTVKNLKLLLRSKGSALIILFAPLLIILILGLSFNTSDSYGITVGIHSASLSEDVNSFITTLEESGFQVIPYEETVEDCVGDIKSGSVHACVSLPESLKVEENTQKEVVFYIDPSRVNIVWMIQESVKKQFNIKAQEISQELTQNVLSTLSNTQNKISEDKNKLSTVKDKTNSASSSASKAVSVLEKVDTQIADVSYNATSNVSGIQGDVISSKSKISNAIASINNQTSLTDLEKSALRAILNDAKSDLNRILDEFENNDSGIGAIMAAMQSELDDVKGKLSAASTAISSANTDLSVVSSSLKESSSGIDQILTSLEEASSNLGSQKVTEAGVITSPLTTRIERVSEEGTYLNYLFPALLVLVVMFSSLLLGTTLVMMERNSPAFLRNFFLPIQKINFIASIYLTNLILILVELAIILGLSLIFLKGTAGLLPSVALILLITASVFTFIGMGIGYIFNSEETGVLASISLGSIFLFLSGVILPLESVSKIVKGFVSFNPFVIAESLIREIFIFNTPLGEVTGNLYLLLGYAVVLFVVIWIAESTLHNHLVQRFMRHHHMKHRQKDKKNKNKKK